MIWDISRYRCTVDVLMRDVYLCCFCFNPLEAALKSYFDFTVWVMLQHVTLDYIAYQNTVAYTEKSEYTIVWAFCMYRMHVHISLPVRICVCVPVSWYHSAIVPGSPAVWRGGCAPCVCLCAWSRCAEPPCAACCPSVLPSVCRLRPRFANSTTPQQEDPGERDVERRRESEAKRGKWERVTAERTWERCACYCSNYC